MADSFRKAKSLYASTSNTFGTGTGVTITPNSVSGLPTDTEITLTFDRVDSSGTATPNAMERIIGTISGGNFVVRTSPSTGRGADGTSDAAHTSPVVESLPNALDHNSIIDGILVGHTQAGAHISSLPLTTPKITTSINDANGNEVFITPATGSAVNEWTATNSAAGNNPILEPSGSDSPIAGHVRGKSSFMKHSGIRDLGTVGATETVSWNSGDRQKMTLDENLTITFSNATEGQTITLYMLQDGSGTNTITFSDTIVWSDATTPTWTTTASKMNIAVITYIGSAYYGVGNKFA